VAAKGVTVLDDGTLPDRRGSLNVDDEGHASQRNVLIEDGILKGYIQDSLNARLMGVKPTGNGRRESYAHLPMPRMTNTYMLAGDKSKEEIIASIKRGLYATNFGGGQVDITSGKFVFSASEAFWVENGKILYPVKGATLIGNGPDAMTRVSMIGNDLRARHRRRRLRQGRPERAGGRGPADAAHRPPHRRGHGLTHCSSASRVPARSHAGRHRGGRAPGRPGARHALRREPHAVADHRLPRSS
jgi:predicted Zn-dependent protease